MPDYVVSTTFTAKDGAITEAYDRMARGADKYGDRAKGAFDRVSQGADRAGNALQNASRHGSNFGAVLKGLVVHDQMKGGFEKVKQGVTAVLTDFVHFDHEMTQALVRFEDVGPKAHNFKEVLKDTGKAIRDIGATSKFSFTDLAKGYQQIGRSKMFDHKEGIAALVPLMHLNIDAQGDFAESTSAVMRTMGAWALNTEDVGKRLSVLTDMTDLFAQAQSEALITVPEMAETMKTVGPIARAMGYGIKDVTAMMVLLGKAGIIGHEAGTSLKNIFAHLVNPAIQQKFGNMGVQIVDKLTGAPRRLTDIFTDMNKSFEKITPNQRLGVMFEGFGLRGIVGASDLSRQLSDFGKVRASLDDISGRSAELAAVIEQDLLMRLMKLANKAMEKGFEVLDKYGDKFSTTLDRVMVWADGFDPGPIVAGLSAIGDIIGYAYGVVAPFLPILPYIVAGFYAWKVIMLAMPFTGLIAAIPLISASMVAGLGPVGAMTTAFSSFAASLSAAQIAMVGLVAVGSVWAAYHSWSTGKDNVISQFAQNLGIVPKLDRDAEGHVTGQHEEAPNTKEAEARRSFWSGQLNIVGAPPGSTFSGQSIGGAPSIRAHMLGTNL